MRFSKTVLTIIASIISLALPEISLADTLHDFVCPPAIQTNQSIASGVGDYDVSLDKIPNYWQSISFYSGKPKLMASLAPDHTTKTRSDWRFSATDDIYIVCGYNQTNVTLVRQLPKGLHTCNVTYDITKNSILGGIPVKVSCY